MLERQKAGYKMLNLFVSRELLLSQTLLDRFSGIRKFSYEQQSWRNKQNSNLFYEVFDLLGSCIVLGKWTIVEIYVVRSHVTL